MYRCRECDEEFETPDEIKTSGEAYYGVAGLFPDRHPMTVHVCPRCGSEDFEEFTEDDLEEEDFNYYPDDYWESKQGRLKVDEAVKKWKEERQ